ncbi:LOW QUALITY PROTEIN: hypothetical protein U9M48_039235 [Paspalum notatum var. saurae]|uniref:Uncharacterized protein n=1 Tax=Paspalum notatum var. saurae TaxID=547442 RepID=A0AAQ3XEE7_PASNO
MQAFRATNVDEAVTNIAPYLDDTMSEANGVIYFDGWGGLGASAVLESIAEHPPPSLRNKLGNIIHIDCSKWKNRRTLQRTIVHALKLPQHAMDIFDRQDEDDDFGGVAEGWRDEIREVGRVIHQALQGFTFTVVFHNGSNRIIDLNDYGIPGPVADGWSDVVNKVLWTFQEYWDKILLEEARGIAGYMNKQSVTPELAAACCRYLLSLNSSSGGTIDFNWVTHASNYLIPNNTMHGRLLMPCRKRYAHEGNSDYEVIFPYFVDRKRWIVATTNSCEEIVSAINPETTSVFLSWKYVSLKALPSTIFQISEQLHVLKLCSCPFRFSSPPFLHCQRLRFLGLDSCKNHICLTDWELTLSPNITNKMATNIREINIKKGGIWNKKLGWTWRHLRNIRKLRVIAPTYPWETESMDDFTDLVKLELLDLSENSTMQIMPSLSGANPDGCIGLEHVGTKTLPPSLETFSFDAREQHYGTEARISHISMFCCKILVNFIVWGSPKP